MKNKNCFQRSSAILRWCAALMLLAFCSFNSIAQVSTTVTMSAIPIAGSPFASLGAAITAINGLTITGPVVATSAAGSETAPLAGYNLTATGTVSNTIIIQGNGIGSTILTAFTPQVSGVKTDAVIKIVGGDYITMQGFTIQEIAANTTTAAATNNMTEIGIGLWLTNTTNGAQNNIIQNNAISMNVTYQNSIGILSSSSSSSTNAMLAATATTGTNSGNKIYGNTITNVAYGIYTICEPITASINESGWDIGGTSAPTGNNITYGNATVADIALTRFSATQAAGIYLRNAAGYTVRFNTVTSNNLTYLQTQSVLGITPGNGTGPTGVTYTSTISDNNITVTNSGTTNITEGIEFFYGLATGTIVANNNTIIVNHNPTGAAGPAVRGINAGYASATNTCNGNIITINMTQSTGATSGNTFGIDQSGAATTITANSNNITINQTGSGTGTFPAGNQLVGLNPTAAATTINALSNTILFNQTTSVAGGIANPIIGIRASTGATTVNITTSNTITIKQAATGSGTYGTGAITYVDVNAAHGTANVTGNTFNTTLSQVLSTGSLTCVNQNGTVTTLVNIKNNVANINRTAASGTLVSFTTTTGTPSEVADTVSSNNITFTGIAGTTAVTAISSLGGPTGSGAKSICNNTISISGTNTGTTKGIAWQYSVGAGGGRISGNNVTISCAAATVVGLDGSGTSASANNGCNNNTISLTSSATVPTSMIGINATSTGPFIITNNTISNMSFTGVLTSGGTTSGIVLGAGTTNSVSNNSISGISVGAATSTGSPVVEGILISGGTTNTISKNNICGITTACSGTTTIVSGMRISGGTTNTVSNNLISGLTASAASSTDAIRGINITSTTTSSTHNVYYNTVYINASSSGANFGATGIFHTASTTSTTSALNLRNNIIANSSTPAGTGLVVAFRRSSGAASTLANYASTSNNNLFYAGTPGASNLIYSDGTSTAQTMSAYTSGVFTAGTIAPRDAASVSEDVAPKFLSTTCGNSNFLHMSTLIGTQVESAGANILGLTDDYDGDVRNGSTPDIGADEFAGIAADLTAPTISYTALISSCTAGARTLTATITDASGVPTAGAGLPVLYFKINAGSYTASTGSFVSGSTYTFSVGAGSVSGDVVSYYIAAQDNAGTPNVGTFPAAGASGFTANPPAASTPPTTPSTYNVNPTLSGSYTVGAAQTYPTLTAAVNAYNNSCLGGAVTFVLMDLNYSGSETFPIIINAHPDASATNTLTIKPNAASTVITGSVASGALIRLNGADYVTIDGSTSGGTDQSLTITNTNTTAPTAVSMISLGTGLGATNNTIKNCLISTGAITSGASYGISVGGSTPGTTGADNDNNTLQNNTITVAAIGIYAAGTAAVSTGGDDNLSITGNSITTNTILATLGIQAGNALNSSISQNALSILTTGSISPVGISLETGFVSSTVTRNNITQVATTSTGGWGGRGITVGTGTASSALTIANNFISGINGSNWSSFGNSSTVGIAIGMIGGSLTITTTAGGINLYYNTVNIYGNYSSSSTCATSALYVGTGGSALDIRNNIFVNSLNNTGTGTASKSYSIYSAATSAAFSNINYNDYYVSGSQGVLGFIGSDRTTLAAIVTGFGQNAQSQNIAPVFTSASDLHLPGATNVLLDNLGTFIASVTIDYDATTRSLTTPDMGADEFSAPSCTGADGGTITPSTVSVCSPATYSMTSTGFSTGTGSTFQWMISTVSGSGYVNVTGGTGATTTSYTTAALLTPGIYYYVLQTTCSGFGTDLSNELTLTVNPLQSVVITPTTTSTICSGQSVQLSADCQTYSVSGTLQGSQEVPPTGSPATGTVTAVYNANTKALTMRVTFSGLTSNTNAAHIHGPAPAGVNAGVLIDLPSTIGLPMGVTSGTATGTVTLTPTQETYLFTGMLYVNIHTVINGGGEVRAQLTATPNACGSVSYAWSPPAGLNFTNIQNPLASPTTTTTYTVTVTGTGSCTATATKLITVNPAPSVTAAASPNPLCSGSTLNLTASGSGGTSPVASYSFAASSGTYTPIAGGTVLASSSWDDAGPGLSIPLGFTFNFDGTPFTTCNINLNGYVSFGTTTTTTNYTPISTLVTNEVGTISAFGRDLQGVTATGEVRYLSSGGVFTIQWSNARRYNSTTVNAESFNFQIRLYQNTNKIEFVYGTFSNAINATSAVLPQVGIRGTTTALFKNLQVLSTGNWATPTPGTSTNTNTAYYNEATVGVKPASGLTYTFAPALTYSWSGPNTFSSSQQNPSVAAITAAGAGVYTATVTASNGCTASASTASVTVNPVPTPSISGTLAFCSGSSTVLDAGSYTSYLWSTSATTQTISVSTAGTFTVTVTDVNGCSGSTSTTTTVNPLPTPSISGSLSFCSGSSTILDAGAYSSYSWTGGATTQTLSVSTAGTFTITVTDANGCTGSTSATTTVNPLPTPSISGSLTFCSGGSTILDAGAYSSYSWTGGATTQTLSVNTAGTFTVTVTDANGCTGSTSATTTVNPLPTPSISGSLSFCSGSSTILDAGAYSSYSWTGGATTQTLSVNTAGTFTATVTDANGCTGSTSATTTVNPLPTPSISGSLTFCSGGSTILDAGAYSSYSWTGGATTQTLSVNTAGTFTVTVTDANGCTGSTSATTTVNPLPTPSISGSLTFCSGGSTILDAGAYSSYSWTGGATTQTLSVNTAGTFTVTVTDANGCTGSTSATTTVNSLPTPTISGTLTFCNGDSTVLDAGSYSGYNWSTSETTQTITVNTAATFTVTVTDANGCTGSTSATTTIIVCCIPPDITCISNVSQGNGAGTCTAVVTYGAPTVTGTSPTVTYAFTGATTGSGSGDGSGSTFNEGTTTVTLTATNGCGTDNCSFDVIITVNHATAPTSVTSDDPDDQVCSGSSVLLTANGATLGTAGGSYKWYEGGCGTGPVLSSVSTLSVIPTVGTHTYYARIEEPGCPNNTACASRTIIVTGAPPANTVGTPVAPAEACSGTVSLITVNTVGGPNIQYSWTTGSGSGIVLFSTNIGGPFSAGPFLSPTNQVYAQFGTTTSGQSGYNICVQGTNACGSTNNKCVFIRGKVSVPGTITPAAGAVACPNDVTNYTCGVSGGASVYSWTLNGSATPITSGQGTTNATVTYPVGFAGGQLCVTAALSCGGSSTSVPRCMTITNAPAIPGTMTGPSNICPGATGVTYSIPAVAGATGYSWTTPVGTTITSGQNTISIQVSFPANYTGAPPVCVSATSPCASSVARCKTVGSSVPLQPGAISGSTTNICNSTVQYSIAPVTNAGGPTPYTWTNPAGTTIISGQNSTTIQLQVSPTFTSGFLTVTANTNQCAPGSSPARTITIYGKPNTPGTITQNPPGTFCSGAFLNFSVAPLTPQPINTWSVTNGTITAGQGSTNVDVTWGSGSGTVSVIASNGCGNSSARTATFASGCREEGEGIATTSAFSVYPNPAHDKVTVSIDVKESADFTMQLMDLSGRVIISEGLSSLTGLNTYDFDLSHLSKGVYMLELKSAEDNWKTKVVVE